MTREVGQEITNPRVRQYLDGINSGPALARTAFAANAVIRYPGQPPMGVDAYGKFLEGVKAALASLQIATREVFETEHAVAVRWRFEATTKGGRTVTCDGIDTWVIDPNGTIESLTVCYDPSPLLEALQA